MSIDLKIERFGVELANRLFSDLHGKAFVPHSLGAYSGVESELNDDIVRAVKVHMAFFGSYYARVYRDCYDQFQMNQMDFLIFAMDAFPHHLLGEDDDEMMSKFVSSCAFLMDVGFRDANFQKKIPLIWAMFVDLELRDEFYLSGGWAELRKYAWIHCAPAYRFMECFNEVSDGKENAIRHREDLAVQSLFAMNQFYDRNVVESDLPMGLHWVDFVVTDPSVPAWHMTQEIEDLEVFLVYLKDLLNPFATREMVYEELIPSMEMVGMKERDCMDALASGDSGKYPEFKEVLERKKVEAFLKVHRSIILSDSWEDSLVESTDETVEYRGGMESDQLDDWDVSSKTASKSGGYPMKDCHTSPLLPAKSLPKERLTSSLKSPIRENNKERILHQEPVPSEITTGGLSQVEESSGKRSIYDELMESLQRMYPHLIKSISVSEPSESGQVSVTLSKRFPVLESSYNNKILRRVVSDSVESEPESDCSSGLPRKDRRKIRRKASKCLKQIV